MKNANFKATPMYRTPSTVTYDIQGYEGMTHDDIIDACDPNNWGGEVYGSICKVYID